MNEEMRMNFNNLSENERLLIWARHRAAATRDALSLEEEQSQEEEKNPFLLRGDEGAAEPE